VTANSTLTAGKAGLALSGLPSSVLSGAVTIAAAKTLNLSSTDGYTLTLTGPISGDLASSGVEVIGGQVVMSGGAGLGKVKVSGGSLTADTLPLTLGTLEVTGGTATANVSMSVGSLLASAGGLNVVVPMDVISASLSGSAAVNASALNVGGSLVRGNTTYSINAGTFVASGPDMLSAMEVAIGGVQQLTVVGSSPVNQPNVDITVVGNGATLAANSTTMAVFGDLTMATGVSDLTLVTGAPGGISFSDVTVVEDAATIIGDMTVRDSIAVGSSPGVLDVMGDLTLAGTAAYVWELTDTGNDVINVSENLELGQNWTLQIETDRTFAEGQAGGKHVLFTFGDSFFFNSVQFDLSGTPDWRTDSLKVKVAVDPISGDKQVILDVVPEPSVWMLLVTGAVLGLVARGRRRRES
jgi:hypothetical protein